MTVGSHPEEQQIEYGDFDCGFVGEDLDEFLLVCICEFLGIRDEGFIDVVDLFGGERDFGEEVVVAGLVIRVFAVERDGSLIRKEDFPEKLD